MSDKLKKSIESDHNEYVDIWKAGRSKRVVRTERIKNRISSLLTDNDNSEVTITTSKKKHTAQIKNLKFKSKRGIYRGWNEWGEI